VQAGPVPELARDGAQVSLVGEVVTDPLEREGAFGAYVVVRLRVDEITGRGATTSVASPVLVIADPVWLRVSLGDRVLATGLLQPAQGSDLAGVLIARGPAEVLSRAHVVDRSVAHVRSSLTEAASVLPEAERALVPALVDGDDSQMPEDVATDFRTTGLTHLLAVSGANFTLMLGFLLVSARWCGVRGRWLLVVGAAGVVFFVLLARPEPSVLRAAAMGTVGLVGLSAGGRRRGARALCIAVAGLVLVDPWLARSVGFLLSTVATAGILLLAPRWRDGLARWMPRPLAEAIAVPLAAQLACTPAIAAISGQVSIVAVVANMVVAPAVGPTTLLGLVAGLLAIVSDGLGHLVGYAAGVPAWWIVSVAQLGAGLAGASMTWPVGAVSLTALTLIVGGSLPVISRMVSHRGPCLACAGLLVVVIVQPIGRPGWPPGDWLMVMCDVGQGDAMVLNAGHGTAVVVDTGPDPSVVDGCLDRLGIDRVPLVVLTHFHADHTSGLPGVLDGRTVDEVQVSPLADPPDQAAAVTRWAAEVAVPVSVAVTGERRQVGQLSWEVLGPIDVPYAATEGVGSEGSAPNNASVVMLVEVRDRRLLLTGDAEPEEEDDILDSGAELQVDVLKVAHHGSANQEPDFVFASGAPLAVISVGEGNDYGHPSAATLGLLRRLGAQVYRTDLHGDIAIVERAGQLAVVTSKSG
jgi:competence protein ComEC